MLFEKKNREIFFYMINSLTCYAKVTVSILVVLELNVIFGLFIKNIFIIINTQITLDTYIRILPFLGCFGLTIVGVWYLLPEKKILIYEWLTKKKAK